MPTVLRARGFRFFFFSNEGNEPPHVHLERADGHAKFWLDPVSMVHSTGLSATELRQARGLISEHAEDMKERWNEYFGI